MARQIIQRLPVARSQGLLIEHVGSETVIYETDSKEAHCLSPLAAAVFSSCDGATTVEQLTELAGSRLVEPVGIADVREALIQLDQSGLLERPAGGLTRRGMIRKTAGATAALTAVPMVTSVITSAYAQAASPSPACPRDLCSSQGKGDDFCNTVGVPQEDSCECEDCSVLDDLGIPCPTPVSCDTLPPGTGGCEPGKQLDGLCILLPGDT